jgi:hypothetical protein
MPWFALTQLVGSAMLPGMPDRTTPGNRPDTMVTIGEAARRLGLSSDAVRRRIHRGLLEGEKINGEWHLAAAQLPPLPGVAPGITGTEAESDRRGPASPGALPGDLERLVAAQAAEIDYLRQTLDAEIEARRRADHLLAGTLDERRQLVERIEALIAGQDTAQNASERPGATEPAKTAGDASASFWARLRRLLTGS